jgi:hypothetical protein
MSVFSEHGTKIYGAATAFLGTLATLVQTGAFVELLSKVAIGWLGIFCALATAVIGGMTMARGFNNTTASKTAEKVADVVQTALMSTPPKQVGFTVAAMLGIWLSIAVVSIGVMTLAGCTQTTRALRNADTPSDYALLFLEGYDAAVKTAGEWKRSGTLAGDTLAKVQAAELKAWPLVEKIDPLRKTFERTQSAEDAQALQLAVDDAIREAAEFVKLVKELRSGDQANLNLIEGRKQNRSWQWMLWKAESLKAAA